MMSQQASKSTRVVAVLDVSNLKEDGDTQVFAYTDAFGREASGVVVRWQDKLHAYQNLCPHWAIPLIDEADEDRVVIDLVTGELVCGVHGARFEAASGRCTSGPCVGDDLRRFHVEVQGDQATIKRAGISLSP